MISSRVKEIEAAYNSLKKISRDKMYESKLKRILDQVSSMDENYHEGRTKGEKKAMDIAKSLITSNLSDEEIAIHTGLSIEDIKSLKGLNRE